MKNDAFPPSPQKEGLETEESTRNVVEDAINRSKDDDALWGEPDERDLQTQPGHFSGEFFSSEKEKKVYRKL